MSTLLLPSGVSRDHLREALCIAERIAGKDRSNLWIVSQFFDDRARYDAFIAMYAVMRLIDDQVDDVADKALLPQDTRDAMLSDLDAWESRIKSAYAGRPSHDAIDVALAAAVETFPVPIGLWFDFLDAMRFDVRKPRFDDFDEFLSYGEGATVAPTSIYVYLLTAQRQAGGHYTVDGFDFISCGRNLGRFAYIAHVLRDVCEDLHVGQHGLVYLSIADLRAHQLTETDLRALAGGRACGTIHARWRALVRDICGRAQRMRHRGAAMARDAWEKLPSDCAFIFRLIVGTYGELLDRIDADPECVLRSESVLTDQDKVALLRSAADATGFRPQALHA